ncbi:hypothetical protein [Paenibacillus sp. MBLB4367]|uniref:hypothetical protein n=1 Tax=Paenibacillus sp. MBLB4367 TaxID=3384767 RepID=UPI0039081FA1
MPKTNITRQQAAHAYIHIAKPWLPLFAVWGAEWMIVSITAIIGKWKFPSWLDVALLGLAVLLSIGILIRSALGNKAQAEGDQGAASGLVNLLPALILAAAVVLLERLNAVDPYFRELFRSLLLSFFYVQLGVFAGRTFIYLGLWLFALSAIVGSLYIGFSVEVLGLFGGASLVACGWLLGRMARGSASVKQ